MRITLLYLLPLLLLGLLAQPLWRASPRAAVPPSPPVNATDLVKQGDDALTKGLETNDKTSLLAAANLYEAAASLDPKNLDVQKTLGWIYLSKLNDAEKAYPHLEKVAAAMPEDVGWKMMLAQAAVASGRTYRAIYVYRDIVARNPHDVPDRLALGNFSPR